MGAGDGVLAGERNIKVVLQGLIYMFFQVWLSHVYPSVPFEREAATEAELAACGDYLG